LRGELDREWDEPRRLPSPGPGASNRGVLLEQPEKKRTFGRELPVDRPLGEACSVGNLVQGRDLNASFREHAQAGLQEKRPCFGFTSSLYDTHENQRYLWVSFGANRSLEMLD